MQERKNTHHKDIKPWRDALLVGAMTFVSAFACSTIMYYYASKGLLNEVHETLFRPYAIGLIIAFIFSVMIGLVIRSIRQGHMVHLAAHRNQLEALRRFHQHISNVTRGVSDISFKIDGKTAQISGMAQTSSEKTIAAVRSIQGSGDKMHAIADASERLLQVVHGLSGTIDGYAQTLKDNSVKMVQANDSSLQLQLAMKNISGVVGMINDITERIDLLALNAAIEAARAGDAGKGFAVVAGEVKLLAGQARSSTEQIVKNITEMNKVVALAINSKSDSSHLDAAIDLITQQTRSVILEQEQIVGYINEDIKSVAQSSAEIIEMVNVIAEVATDTSTKTMRMHKDVHLLYEQNSSLSSEVEKFVKTI